MISHKTAEPVYVQLSILLKKLAIQIGPGGRLPSEAELVKQYKVSRSTVRHSIETLIDQGLLVRRQGKGTFVKTERIVHPLDYLRPFVTIFEDIGENPKIEVLIYEWISNIDLLPEPIASKGQKALHVQRLYKLNENPIALIDIFVPGELGKQISRSDIEEHPVYHIIQNKLGREPSYADVTVSSTPLINTTIKYLNLKKGTFALCLQRTSFDAQGDLLESSLLYLNPNNFELKLRIDAQGLQEFKYDFDTESAPRLSLIQSDLNNRI